MARGFSRQGHGDVYQNGDLPPSILAAQLYHRMEEDGDESNQDNNTFRQLLQEILDGDDEPSSSANDVDGDLTCKLLFVIVKAGLDPLQKQDPFINLDERTKQAVESLKAIARTLRRTPNVLYLPLALDGNANEPGVPLLLWLLPRLLSLFSMQGHDEIKASCRHCLITMLTSRRKIHVRGFKPNSISKYIQGFIGGKHRLV